MSRISNPSDIVSEGVAPLPANGKTILIAEDDPFIARMYEAKLKLAGYAVSTANNGRNALESIKLNRPDLILLDINMPELSGFEVLGALAGEDFDFSSLPILVLTNSSNAADRKTAESYGAEYMIKAELTPRAVLERINAKLAATAEPKDAAA